MINTQDLLLLLPEILLTFGILVILIIDLLFGAKYKIISYYFSCLLLLLVLIANLNLLGVDRFIVAKSFTVDNFAVLLKTFVLFLMVILMTYAKEYLVLRQSYVSEYLILLLFSTLGMLIMLSGTSILVLYLGLEILSLSLYSLIALNKNQILSIEAGLKYFVLGAIASGILLYGMSLLYGATNTLLLTEIISSDFDNNQMLLNFAIVFIVIGIAFKLGAAPFHNWVPDVYQGSTMATTMLLSSVPKLAVIALIYRIFIEGLNNFNHNLNIFLFGLGILSIIVGTIVALVQKNLKRLLAYSTIANIGFILLSFATGQLTGYSSGVFYTVVYAFTVIATFGVLIVFSNKDYEINNITELSGLANYNAFFSFMLLVLLLSMAGIPPFIGFWAKLSIITALVDSNYLYIAVFMVVFAVIGAYYYLQLIRILYFNKAHKKLVITANIGVKIILAIHLLLLLYISFAPNSIMTIMNNLFH